MTTRLSRSQARAALARIQPETEVQRSLLDWFAVACPDALVFAIPNGERRDARTGAKLKRQGVLAGAADLVFIHRGIVAFIEVKRADGRLSPAQKRFQDKCAEELIPYCIARGIGDVHAFLHDLGIPVKEAA